MSSLIFPPTSERNGFTEAITSSSLSSPEPVVRELIQNSWDAVKYEARELKLQWEAHKADITFTIAEHDIAELPGIHEYQQAFHQAKKARAKTTQGEDEKRIIRRIEQTLQGEKIKVLYCRDNGIGLDAERMEKLFWVGNTTKAEKQSGAFGLGHMFPFQASNLRYLLYAGRNAGNGTGNNNIRELASGHAILAAHPQDSDSEVLSANGYIVEKYPKSFEEHPVFGSEIAPILRRELAKIAQTNEKTGSVVAITGFNNFNEDSSNEIDEDELAALAAEEILKAAARNFFVAIVDDNMQVSVAIQKTSSSYTLDNTNIQTFMEKGWLITSDVLREENNAKNKGFLSGSKAHEAIRTIKTGKPLELAGADVYIRHTDSSARKKHEVNLCRNGMWITNDIPKCQTPDFGKCAPFNTVILLQNEDAQIHELIRKAETPEHREIVHSKLEPADKKQLLKLLGEIAQGIRDHVGEIEEDEVYRPDGFAIIDVREPRQAERKKPYRLPGMNPSGKSIKGEKKGKGSKSKNSKKPSPGAAVPIRTSQRLVAENNSLTTNRLIATVAPDSNLKKPPKFWGVQVYRENGSDESCEYPVPLDFLAMEHITLTRRSTSNSSESTPELIDATEVDTRELRFKSSADEELTLKITLQDAVATTDPVRVQLVERNKPLPQEQQEQTVDQE